MVVGNEVAELRQFPRNESAVAPQFAAFYYYHDFIRGTTQHHFVDGDFIQIGRG